MMKEQFEMTDEDLKTIIDASKPVTYMVFGGVEPASPQENANNAWKTLGNKLGFIWDTVEPCGENDKLFMADPKEILDTSDI